MDDATRSLLDDAIKKIENAAYERGCRDTLRKFELFMAGAKVVSADEIDDHLSDDPTIPVTQGRPPEGSGEGLVLADIEAHPGAKGFEIVHRLAEKVHERTVRTALFRLRQKKLIFRIERAWYPPKEASTN